MFIGGFVLYYLENSFFSSKKLSSDKIMKLSLMVSYRQRNLSYGNLKLHLLYTVWFILMEKGIYLYIFFKLRFMEMVGWLSLMRKIKASVVNFNENHWAYKEPLLYLRL